MAPIITNFGKLIDEESTRSAKPLVWETGCDSNSQSSAKEQFMSTQYVLEPPIKYEEFLLGKSFEVHAPPRKVYIVDHKVIKRNKTYLYVYNIDGNVRLEAFGANNIHNIAPAIMEEFNVKIFDEYGLEFPDCL